MKKDDHLVVALVSLVLAATLHVMPVTGSWIVWKPNFLLLVTMAWIFRRPSEFGVFFAASVGIFADFLMRSTLGHHMLMFAFCGALIGVLSRWSQFLSFIQRIVLVSLIVLLVGFVEASIFAAYDISAALTQVPMVALFSALFWPIIDKLIARSSAVDY